MLSVKTEVKPSKIPGAGLGLFAAENIASATKIWEFTKGFDLIFQYEDIASIDEVGRSFIKTYAYRNQKHSVWVLCIDNDRFINHSEQPNIIDSLMDMEDGYSTALRDIKTGEELTCDYRKFDASYRDKLA